MAKKQKIQTSSYTPDLDKKITSKMEDKWQNKFNRQAGHKGNGIYGIGRLHSTDTRELFLMFVADMENIDYKGKVEEHEDEVE